jgi:hypothetical protein
MIYGFVRQSGGQVRIYSEVGQGTTRCHSGAGVGHAQRQILANRQVALPRRMIVKPPVRCLDGDPTALRHGVARVPRNRRT